MDHTHKSRANGFRSSLKMTKYPCYYIFYHFLLPFHLAILASKGSEKFRLDRKIDFQNTFYPKCINVIIDSIGPSIILRSIFAFVGSYSIMVFSCESFCSYLKL